MPFPILRLPFLALKVVMACGEDVELFKMSLCSRRANKVIKACERDPSFFNINANEIHFNDLEKVQLLLLEAKHPNVGERLDLRKTRLDIQVSKVLALSFHIEPFIDFFINIDSISQMEKYTGCRKYLEFEGIVVPFIFENDELHSFWEDKVDGLRFFVNYFEKNIRLKYLSWKFRNPETDLRRHVCYLNSLPKESNSSEDRVSVRAVTVQPNAELSHSDYKYLMETVTHDFYGLMNTSEDFEFIGQFATQVLVLTSAHWFTLEHLLECKCQNVRVVGSNFTNKQLNVFIRKWSTGELSHIKSVSVGFKEKENINVIVRGIEIVADPQRGTSGKTVQGATGQRARVMCPPREMVFHKISF